MRQWIFVDYQFLIKSLIVCYPDAAEYDFSSISCRLLSNVSQSGAIIGEVKTGRIPAVPSSSVITMVKSNGLVGIPRDSFNGTENSFCRGPYFDYNLSWNTTNPNLAQCFLDTTLIGTPSIAFWVLAAVWIGYQYIRIKSRNLKGIVMVKRGMLRGKFGQPLRSSGSILEWKMWSLLRLGGSLKGLKFECSHQFR